MPTLLHRDTIAGLLLMALATAYAIATRSIPDSSLSDAVGATGLPNVLAAALAILAAILVAKGVMAARLPPAGAPALEDGEEPPAGILRALGFVVIGVGYMIVAPLTGYAVGIAALVIAVALYERQRASWLLFAVAAGGGIGFWLIFVRLLGTEQPVSRLLG
jgi:putative tricarboxylic transport membrane protein